MPNSVNNTIFENVLQVEIEITSKQKTVLPEDKTVSLEKQCYFFAGYGCFSLVIPTR